MSNILFVMVSGCVERIHSSPEKKRVECMEQYAATLNRECYSII